MRLGPVMASAAVHSKAVILLFLVIVSVSPIICVHFVFSPCLMHYLVSFLV